MDTTTNRLKMDELKKIESSSLEGNDFVGIYHKYLLRIVRKNIKDYKMALKFSNNIDGLVKAEIFLEEENRLILKHPIIKNITYPDEWTTLQKIEAAETVLNIQKQLNKKRYYLADPHGFNITFDIHKPIYLDFGSIIKGNVSPIFWFLRSFINYGQRDYWGEILKISKVRSFLIIMSMFLSGNDAHLKVEDTLSKLYSREIKRRDYTQRDNLEKMLRRVKFLLKGIRKIFNKSSTLWIVRDALLKKLCLRNGRSQWSYYSQENVLNVPSKESKRVANFIKLLKRDSPKKLLDIGANKGAFSKLSLKYGVEEVIAMDIDERSLDILRRDVKNNDLPIWTARVDLMNHPPTLGHFKGYPAAEKRLNSDYCICFALIHHLCYFGNYSFDNFAEVIEKFANKILIVEFIPYNDIHLTGPIYKGKHKPWYTRENFIKSMKKYFKGNIEICESEPPPRILIRFQK